MQPVLGTPPLTPEALAALGAPGLAYVKPIVHEDQPAYAIHTADGTLVAIAASRDLAFSLVRQNELEPVDAH